MKTLDSVRMLMLVFPRDRTVGNDYARDDALASHQTMLCLPKGL